MGVAVRHAGDLPATGRVALLVPALADRAPGLIDDPPTAVPPTVILSGVVMGICGLVLMSLRRAGVLPRGVGWLLGVGSVLAVLPLPSRFFLLAFAVGLVALAPGLTRTARGSAAPAGTAVPAVQA